MPYQEEGIRPLPFSASVRMDQYVYTPDDELLEGVAEEGKLYREGDFNRIIEIKQREAYRVKVPDADMGFDLTNEYEAAMSLAHPPGKTPGSKSEA